MNTWQSVIRVKREKRERENCPLPMNLTSLESLKRLGFLRKGSAGRSTVDNTTPSPQAGGGDRRRKLGPPPTRPTHQTEKANLPNGNTLAGVTKQSYCRVSEPISPTGTKAPESLAATLHAAATEVESPRFMGTIKHCPRRSSLSMNVVARTFLSAGSRDILVPCR